MRRCCLRSQTQNVKQVDRVTKVYSDPFSAWQAKLELIRQRDIDGIEACQSWESYAKQCNADRHTLLEYINKLKRGPSTLKLEAAIDEIAAGFLPDGTYGGRPIYTIVPECFESETACGEKDKQ